MKSKNILETEGIQLERSLEDVHKELRESGIELTRYFPTLQPNKKPEWIDLKSDQSPDNKMKGFRLYQIKELFEQCNELAEIEASENMGVISDNLAEQLDKLEIQKGEKVLSIAKIIKDLESRDESFDKAIERMQKRQKSNKSNIERLMNYLTLHLSPGECFEDPEIKLTWKPETGTEIFNLSILPDQYCKFVSEIPFSELSSKTINLIKELVKEDPICKIKRTPLISEKINPDLKKGKQVPGARKKEGKYIVIK